MIMEVSAVTYYGWQDNLRTVEKRITYDYPKGSDVTVVEHRSYQITLYTEQGKLETYNKGSTFDQLA
jgi:hypothetical protein